MELIQAIIIIVLMWSFVLLVFTFMIFWFRRNNISIRVAEEKNNLILFSFLRARESKGKYYLFKDWFSKKPIDLNVDDCKNFYITSESIPIFGVKKILNVKKIEDEGNILFVPYLIYNFESEVLIDDNMVAWVNEARTDLYKSTELQLSTKDQIIRLIVPIGIILLAISCLIFFPKIYESVMQTGNAVANSAISGWTQKLTEFIPKG